MESPIGGEDMFIRFDGIDGESKDADHTTWSDANAFGFGASNDGSPLAGPGATGSPSLNEFVVSKPIDRASPPLFQHMLTGNVIPQATFQVCRSVSGVKVCYLQYTFDDVQISSVTTGTTAETLTFQYSTVEKEYTPITPSGGTGSPVTRVLDRTMLGASIATTPGTESEVQGAPQGVFVRADGIDGESQEPGRQDWIDGEGFGLCVRAPSGGTPSFGDITVIKRVDAASPLLLDHAVTGKHVPTVDVDICKVAGHGATVCHLEYNLEDVLVTSVGTQGDAERDAVTESMTLTFAKIELTYTEFDETGSSSGTERASWDLETGTVG